MDATETSAMLGVVGLVGFIISLAAAWITHVIWWVKLLMNEEMDTLGELFLAGIGTFVPPIGIIHGYILWF